MPSTPKRPSLGRLLASLRPSRGGTSPSHFPVQTGFPTSLADLVVRNHGRLRKARKPRRPNSPVLAPAPTAPPVALTVEVDDELNPPPTPPAEPLSPVVQRRLDSPPRREGGAAFRLRPEILAVGGAVALALLAVWSEGTVAAFTVAALSLLWIESASRRRQRLPRPAEAEELLDSCGRGPASPIRPADDEAPRSSCSDSDKGSEAPSPRTAERREFLAAAGEDPTTPKQKTKRSLRKLISKKLQRKPSFKDSSWPPDGEADQPSTGAGKDADPVLVKTESSVSGSESSIEWSSSSSSSSVQLAVVVDRRVPGVKFPLWALVPVILAGLAAGKLPATALAVLCVAFSGAVQRLQ